SENTQYHINSTSQRITLTKPEPAKAKLKINIRENGLPISNASFNIKLDGENNYTKLTNNSSETFELVYGTYFLSISDPDRDYGTVTKTIIINKSNTDETIEVSKTIKSKINIIVKDSISGALIENAIVNVKNVSKKTIDEYKTKEDGKAIFAITDKGKLYITAKKAGGIGEGYFVKEIELEEPGLDNNIEIKLSKITTNNAGKTIVKVIDQDNEIVSNARITLRYEKDDSLVELNENQNFVLSDINGYATFLAGKVDDKAYAHASKYPFDGKSNSKTIALEGDNEFEIIMQIGETPIEIIVTNEKGENITGKARLYNLQNEEVSGLMAIENGKVNTKIKAGKIVYLAVNSENHETYYSEPRFLWPNKKEVFQIIINTEISEPKVIADGKLNIFNEQDEIVRTMKAGNKYYTLIRMDSDKTYNNALLHFRAGTEELLENDFIEIDKIETVGNFVEVRGKSYSPQRGYSYDSENLTDSLSKWVTINWNGITQGTRIVKIHFRIKPNTPSNKELQFFWRASFDDNKKPESNASEELYDDTYASNIYFEGEEAVCITDFCIAHEYLFDTDEQLYLDKPYEIEQIKQYHYQFQIINNSNTDYGTDKKKMGLNLEMISEQGMGAKVIEYTIKDSKNEVSGQSLQSLTDLEIGSFEKNTTINIILTLEGNNSGNSALKIGLKSDGRIIYSNEENFSVPSQKEMSVSLDTSFVPSLINTQIIVDVKNAGEPINEAIIKVFAKEPGFDEYLIEENITNRLGKAQVNSGAHFPSTKVIIEIAKKGYSRKRLELSVSDDIVFYNPTQLSFELNTITKKDEKIVFEIGNATGKKLEIYSIKTNAKFANAINEDALQSYLNGMKGVIIEKDDVEKLDVLMRIQNSLTEDMMIEPINIQGNIIISLRAIETNIIFDTFLPININIGSGAQTGNDCLLLSNVVQSKVTEKGRVTFTFELLNACEANDIPVKIRDLSVTSTSEIDGSADLLIQSYSTSKSGRTAIDSMTRTILPEIGGEEKLVGTLTYIPSETAVGKTINIPLTLQAKFQNQIITTNPTQAKFTVDVINLKECVKIDSSRTPVAFN
ncbi:MAG: hypothetical protein PHX27_04665, partial [Candidatus ainarchaeum sp.]|nr:hypothetical protein [Candidatus ainarchaeum sp.]